MANMMEKKLQRVAPYLVGAAIFLALMTSYAGLGRTAWWAGLTVGCTAVGVLGMWVANSMGDERALALAAKVFSAISFLLAGALLLFGTLVVLKVVASPFWPSSYGSDDLPENWRR
jgi:hypothetical protein